MLSKPASGLVIANKYKLLEPIGSGGMSEVYRAENMTIGRNVALKLLNPNFVGDDNLTARFFQEAKSASRIRHPSIVDVLDAGEGETGPYLVMELLSGCSAAALLVRFGKYDVAAALATAIPVLSALSAAHAVGVVHRDLKPENIFFHREESEQVCVKLLDFGIAKLLSPAGPTPRTSTGIVFGTPDYLSPEQAAGDSVIDGRSDLFSVAVVLYELLTGVRPFHAPTTVATAYRIAHAKAPSLKDNGGPDHPLLDAIMQRALAKRPEERHRFADELRQELETIVPERERIAALHRMVGGREGDMETSGVLPRLGGPAPSTLRADKSSEPITLKRTDPTVRSRYSATPLPHSVKSVEATTPSGRSRSTPPRFANSRSVRGSVLRSLDGHVLKAFGALSRGGIVERLGAGRSVDLEQNTVQGIVLYDLDLVAAYIDLVTRELCRGNGAWCRVAGEKAINGELAPMFRHLSTGEDGLNVLRRAVPGLARLFDFGRFEVEAGEPCHTLRVNDFEPAPLGLRWWLLGAVDGLLAAFATPHSVSVARGDAAFAPQLVLEVTPR
jgi:serine/threonine-protein kinase